MVKNFENDVITPSVIGLDEEGGFVIGEKQLWPPVQKQDLR